MSIGEEYPSVARLRLEVTVSPAGVGGETYLYAESDALPRDVPCGNRLCHNGGFRVDWTLKDIVQARKSEANGSALCPGRERYGTGSARYQDCAWFFKWRAQVEYHPEGAEGDD